LKPVDPFPDPQEDYRAHPERYRVGRGERGVLTVQPYKGELLPHWRFRTPDEAEASARTIFGMFETYRDAGDGVGMDMARKFLQMGFTRSRRYANHRGGRKYDAEGKERPREIDEEKARSAEVFRAMLERAKADPKYQAWRESLLP
jgi:hypothetical protein